MRVVSFFLSFFFCAKKASVTAAYLPESPVSMFPFPRFITNELSPVVIILPRATCISQEVKAGTSSRALATEIVDFPTLEESLGRRHIPMI